MESYLTCFAVENEARPFRSLVRDLPQISVLVTGMGKENAEKQLVSSLRKHRPGYVITSGFAGGIDPGLKPETIVFSASSGFPLSDRIMESGACPVKFLSVPQVLCSASDKMALWKKTGIQATDMESDAIHEVCRQSQISCATLRIISDSAYEDLPLDFNQVMDEQHCISVLKLALALARNPKSLPPLLRFHRRIQSAADKLARFLVKVLAQSLENPRQS